MSEEKTIDPDLVQPKRATKKKAVSKRKPKKKTFKQGFYTPRHPEKYVGNIAKIRFMSSWELYFNQFLDNNPNIIRWASEEIAIPYIKPTTKRQHLYYPDYWIEYKSKSGETIQEIIEVKPEKETKPPRHTGRKKASTKIHEDLTYAINEAKWEYAEAWCKERKIIFRKITEKELFSQ